MLRTLFIGDNLATAQKFAETGDVKLLGKVVRNNILISEMDRTDAEARATAAELSAEARIEAAHCAADIAEQDTADRPYRRAFEASREAEVRKVTLSSGAVSTDTSIDNDALVTENMNF